MRILAFSDTHCKAAAKREVERKAKRADVLVCAGDFTLFEEGIKEELAWMDRMGKPVFLVHGNHEEGADIERLCRKHPNIRYVHKHPVEYDGMVFVGFGGDGFSLINKEFERFARKLKLPNKKVVFITHQPPHGTKLDFIWDHHGNKSFRDFIDKVQPALAICGHLHETAGMEEHIGKTRALNPGDRGKIILLAAGNASAPKSRSRRAAG